ncbi:MAG: transcriptional repressor [Verrucomicrobiota bacterium JB023]|nr:transcriptional repressor [Verrucomicrobiota bacterium JB023]
MCVDSVLAKAREVGLRKTRALEAVVNAMAEAGTPVTLNELEKSEGVEGICDRATLFRLLNRLSEHGLARRLGLHERAAHFALATPNGHHDYLICRACGSVELLDQACPVREVEEEIKKKTGYTGLYHELEIYGVCPVCADE